jgi:uncharacterized protein (TIGR03435 family)
MIGKLAVLVSVSATIAFAQAPAPLAFEVASVKAGPGEKLEGSTFIVPGRFLPGGRFEARNSQLLTLVRRAYEEFSFEPGQIMGPTEILEERFDVDGRAGSDVPEPTIRLMLRQLLADRFKLRVHTENRLFDAYELVPARADRRLGPQIRPAKADCKAINAAVARGEMAPPRATVAGGPVSCGVSSGIRDGAMRYYLGGRPIANLAIVLQNALSRRVTDKTGLAGEFDVELFWAVDSSNERLPSLLTAVRDQLGFRLQLAKAEMEVLVIDHIERPTPD